MHDAIGIRHGQITTLHNPTNTNVVVDAPHKDLRRARSATTRLVPNDIPATLHWRRVQFLPLLRFR